MILTDPEFETMRPYTDAEIPAAMARVAAHPLFARLAAFVFPDRDVETVRESVRAVRNPYELQEAVMQHFVRRMLDTTATQFTHEGFDRLRPDGAYLFVANHRDIVADSAILQYLLFQLGLPTTEITFGANLMTHPLVVDVGRSNKMFRVERGGTPREFYAASCRLSRYMRQVIETAHSSVWIAQRNGRTKDGIDATDPGLVKMLTLSGEGSPARRLAALHIVPTAVSYEWEPCDLLKAREVVARRRGPYAKAPDEDLQSILTGLLAPKGRVYLAVCPPLTFADLEGIDALPRGEMPTAVAALLDRRIVGAYRLMPTHYAAADLLEGTTRHSAHYAPAVREALCRRLDELTDAEERQVLLGIYAHPVRRRAELLGTAR